MDAERGMEQAVLAAVAARDLEENKRKRREELDAAEEEAAKRARKGLEMPSPSSPPASMVLDGETDRTDRRDGEGQHDCGRSGEAFGREEKGS